MRFTNDTFEREGWVALKDEAGTRLFSDDTTEEEKETLRDSDE